MLQRYETYFDVFFRGVSVLVDMAETDVRVPEQAESQGRGGTHHTYFHVKMQRRRERRGLTVILVLVDPAVPLFRLDHQLVVTEASVDKGIDKGTSQVAPCRVDVGSRPSYAKGSANFRDAEMARTCVL
jgi:hypothetical protein